MMKKVRLLSVIVVFMFVLAGCSVFKQHTHEFGEWHTVKEATCTEKGYKERECSCGEKNTKEIPYATHQFGEWVVVKKSSCTEAGLKERVCSCGEKETRTIPELSHNYSNWKTVESATCEKAGSEQGTCSVCGKIENRTIKALGHVTNDYFICQRCGKSCPGVLNMTYDEQSTANAVQYCGYISVDYNIALSQFEISFELKDKNKRTLAVPCAVDIRIINNANEVVYSATRKADGIDHIIYIKESEITPGKSIEGAVYCKVYNPGYFSFSEDKNSIFLGLPIKRIPVSLPSLPKTISVYSGKNKVSSCKVTEITYESWDAGITFYVSLEKTFDSYGPGQSNYCKVGWKLYDTDGYVVDSGTMYSEGIKTGEKVRNASFTSIKVELDKSYRLEILDVN